MTTDVEPRCCRCREWLDLKVYTVNDFRDGFIIRHVYCSEECLQADGAVIKDRPCMGVDGS